MDLTAPGVQSKAVLFNSRPTAKGELGDFSLNTRVLLLSAMAAVTGLISSVAAWVLLWLISAITNLAFYHRIAAIAVSPEGHHLGRWVILVPVAGALIIGLMARYGSDKIRGHGIPEALEAILLGRSKINLKVALLKPLSSAISIGTGGPFGAEGPIIMTGGAFGSLFAQRFHLSAAERKTLLVAGAAAGMTAVFAAPVASVLLAVELLLFEWKPRSFIPVVSACLVASLARVPLLGAGPVFAVASHGPLVASQLGWAVVVGIAAGFGSALLTKIVYQCEDFFARLPLHWMWWPALGALVVGICGAIDPRVLGVGYGSIHDLLAGRMTGVAVGGLLLAKGLAWSIALGSGTSGGVLAPLLMIGGGLGALAGGWIPGGDPALWATIGMAAMMGGTMRAPLTAMVFTIELNRDFHLFPALLAGSAAGLAVTALVMPRSILTEKLARRGHHIFREYSVDPFELVRVKDVMETNFPSVPTTMMVAELAHKMATDARFASRQAVLVVDEQGKLGGIITRGDIVRALGANGGGDQTVAEVGSTDCIVTYADEPLTTAIARLLSDDIGRMPVVDASDPRKIVGYLGRSAILSARKRLHDEEHVREKF